MKLLTSALGRMQEFKDILAAMDGGFCPVAVSGLAAVHRAHVAGSIGLHTGRPVVVVCADESEAERMVRDLSSFTEQEIPLLSPRPYAFHSMASVSHQWEHQRLEIMYRLHTRSLPFLVATIEGLLQRTMPPAVLERTAKTISVGDTCDLAELTTLLELSGYRRGDQVEGVGQYAVRGGILDVFSTGMERPVRAEFFGDEVDAMGLFDPTTQRRTENIKSMRILPVAEILPAAAEGGTKGLLSRMRSRASKATKAGNGELGKTYAQDMEALAQTGAISAADRYMDLIYPAMATAADFFPPDTCVFLSETPRITERAKSWQWQIDEDVRTLLERGILDGSCANLSRTYPQLMTFLSNWPILYLDAFTGTGGHPVRPRQQISIAAKQLSSIGVSPDAAIQDLQHYQKSGYASLVLASGEQHALDLHTRFRESGILSAVDFRLKEMPKPGQTIITVGGLSGGIEYPALRLAVLTEGERVSVKRKRARKDDSSRQKVKSYTDLTPGDLVIHEHHGLGRYMGMVKMVVDGIPKDYVKLAYAGTDVLYVPATSLDLISKYIGGGEESGHRKLNSLGGTDWEKARTKARKSVENLAKELVKLYAKRQKQPGHAFAPDNEWQREFEDEFEFTETDDQLRCAREIKEDMEKPRPMDRLLCGDVGYGKTEVALRAIMKCILDGKQAAILVPTTVLARQHYFTAKRRFEHFPVNVDILSRFQTAGQVRETLRKVKDGTVDLLIGTHRLFNNDLQFRDLGLLVIDEEQRFGVKHKEKLKERFEQVDVLTLSATPIPRTLNMALSGIRDMSTLEEPPLDRQPVQTYVLEHDWNVLADAMRRELERGGQVYYLHNRVETIDKCAAHIQALMGEDVSVGIAHGRMKQDEVDDVMSRMTDGEISILVCTTIIETGIDIANVNTLIIEDADHMGLAQLHQIRGRVGRSARRAFAYLTYRPGKVLTETSEKRLSAIREFAEFGSGFKIAMRDLEIRGAGNVLGPEQSGFLLSVGYDMYLQMLEEAVLHEQGITPQKEIECSANISIPASVPDRYVSFPGDRMDLYRRIAALRTEKDADELVDELIDRYGDPPRQVNNLISIALLRARAAKVGITDIDQRNGMISVKAVEFDPNVVSDLCRETRYRGRLRFDTAKKPVLIYRLGDGQDPLRAAQTLVEDYDRIQRVRKKAAEEKEAGKAPANPPQAGPASPAKPSAAGSRVPASPSAVRSVTAGPAAPKPAATRPAAQRPPMRGRTGNPPARSGKK